jgi:EmrB/QacA subfamily drug resistance transporter
MVVRPSPTRAGLVLALVVTTQLMIVLDNTVVNLALPAIRTDLGFSAAAQAWVSNAYILTFGGLLLLGGRLGDLLGRRAVFAAGVALFTVASLVGGAASDPAMIVAARAVQGVGAAAAAPSALAILLITFPEGPARNRALGLFFAMSAAGGAIGLLVGGALTSLLSWRWVFWINVIPGATVVVLTLLVVGATTRIPGRLDLAGSLASTSAVGSLIYGFVRAGEAGWSDATTLTAFAAGVPLLLAFVAIEARATQPLLPVRLFAGRTRASAYVTMLLVPGIMVSSYFFASQFLQVVAGYTALRTGLAFLPMSATIFAMSRLLPRLLGRHSPRPFMIAGGLALTAASAWLSRLSGSSGYWTGIAPALVLLGLGAGLLYVPVSAIVMTRVRPEDSGAASGTLQTMQQAGAGLGIAVLVSVFGNAQRRGVGSAGSVYADAVAQAFFAGVAFSALALVLIVFGIRPRQAASTGEGRDASPKDDAPRAAPRVARPSDPAAGDLDQLEPVDARADRASTDDREKSGTCSATSGARPLPHPHPAT